MITDPMMELIKNVSDDPGPYDGVNKECKRYADDHGPYDGVNKECK